MNKSKHKTLKLTLVRSRFGRLEKHRAILECLKLRRMHHSVVVEDIPSVRGMVNKIAYLLQIEESE